MRRPSRQGLLSLRASVTTTSVAVRPQPEHKETLLSILFPTIIILALLAAVPSPGYSQDMDSVLLAYFSKVKSGGNPPAPEILRSGDSKKIFSSLQPYMHDSVVSVSAKACEILHSFASKVPASETRSQAVQMLIRALREKDIGMNGSIFAYLTQYARNDFNASARDSIRALVRKEPPYFDRILKLAGFLNLADLIPEIRPWTQPGNPTQIRWAAYLSLARMGDSTAIKQIQKRITKIPLNDNVVYNIFPDLAYTRQRLLIDYMVDALQKDTKSCLSADAEREVAIPCGYRIMEQLANVVAGYPFALSESGDLQTDNYPDALQQVRTWFLTHNTYNLLTNTY